MNSKAIFLFLLLFAVTAIPTSVTAQDEGTIIINANLVNGATYSGILELTVTASHPDGIWYITAIIDGNIVKQESGTLLTHSWDTTLYSDGAHHIQIRSAVNSTFFRAIDFDVFVNNTPTETFPGQLDIPTKISATVGSASVITILLTFACFKSNLIETSKHKIVVVIAGVSIFAVIAGYIWIFL